ncbi:MAG: PucR family transcriptional regulator [Eubacteriales bacterium]
MAAILRELIAKLTEVDLVILAGEAGMTNPMTWAHMVESEEIGNFVEFGELVFTTGIALNESTTLLKVVQKVQKKSACGIIVNLGPYIEEVPEDVITFCKEKDFPLMTVPWRINMANIMRVMTFEITNRQLRDVDFEMAIKNAILYPQDEKMHIKTLQKQLIDTEANFNCIIVQMEYDKRPLKEIKLNKISYLLKNKVAYRYNYLHITTVYNNIVIVVSDSTDEQINLIIQSCKKVIEESKIKVENTHYLVGGQVKGIEKLHISYENAGKLIRVMSCYDSKTDMLEYEDIGIYKLLLEIENKVVIRKYYEETVKAIVEYDNYHNTDLLIVLDKYLKYNGSLKAVAEELFVHRNTVNYKLSKIASLVNCNLSAQEVRTKLEIGIAIYHIFDEELC